MFVIICDPRVLAIPIVEVGEPLADLREFGRIVVDRRRQDQEGAYAHVRSGVYERLLAAQASLPEGFGLLFVEGYRPLERQRVYFDKYLDRLRERHPSWSTEQLRQEASRYVAPPDTVPPHSTGGAVDLTLVAAEGEELDMGTELNASPEDTDGAYFTAAPGISASARRNREILVGAMTAAAFVNYEAEWWHWSYGDRYWAHQTGGSAALYGPIEFVRQANDGRADETGPK